MAGIDHMRELRAKVASGQMTERQAAMELVRRTEGGLTAAGAKDVLGTPTAQVAKPDEEASRRPPSGWKGWRKPRGKGQ